MIETGNFSSHDGTKLFFRAPSSNSSDSTVIVVHGFAEHSGRYREILNALHQKGYGSLAFDFRGHGHSEGRRGYIERFDDYLKDLDAAVAFAKTRNKNQKIILLAHSMGGLVASHFAAWKPDLIDGLVLSSPLFGIRIQVPAWKKRLGALMSKYWPAFGLSNTIDEKQLTHDQEKAEAYRSDPLIFHHVTARWFEEITVATQNSLEIAQRLKQPFLLQLSGDDRIVSYDKSCEWYEKNLSSDKSLRVYADFYHEIYNEKNRNEPVTEFLSWLSMRWPQEKYSVVNQPSIGVHP